MLHEFSIDGRPSSDGAGRLRRNPHLGVNERPYRPHVCFNRARSRFLRQLPQSECSGANALAQPVGVGTGQDRLLVTADLAGRNASSLPPQILPLRRTGRTDLKRFCNRTNSLAPCLAKIFRIGSRHPCWSPFPSMEFESDIAAPGNPDSGKKQHVLARRFAVREFVRQDHCVGDLSERRCTVYRLSGSETDLHDVSVRPFTSDRINGQRRYLESQGRGASRNDDDVRVVQIGVLELNRDFPLLC